MKKYMVLPFLVKLIGLIGLIRPVESQVFSWNVQVPLQSKACSGDSNLTIDWTYTPSNVNPLAIDWVKLQTDGVTVDKAVASYDGTITTFTPAADYVGRVTKPANTAEIAIANPTGTDEGVYRVTVTDSGGSTLIGEANLTFATPAVFAMTAVSGDNTATCGTVTNHGNPKAVLTMTYAGFNQSTDTDQSIIVTCTSRETVSCQLSGPAAVCAGSGASLSASATCDFKPDTTVQTSGTTSDSGSTTIAPTTTPPLTDSTATSPSMTTPPITTTASTMTESNIAHDNSIIRSTTAEPVCVHHECPPLKRACAVVNSNSSGCVCGYDIPIIVLIALSVPVGILCIIIVILCCRHNMDKH